MTTERNWLSCCGALALGEACGFCAERFAALEPVVLGSLLLCSLFGFGLKLRGWTLLAVFLSGLALAFGAVLAREAVLNEVLRGDMSCPQTMCVRVSAPCVVRTDARGVRFLSFDGTAGPVRLRVVGLADAFVQEPTPGETWDCTGWLARKRPPPGQARALWVRGPGTSAVRRARPSDLSVFLAGLRRDLSRRVGLGLEHDPPSAAMNRAMLLGERREIAREAKERFVLAGTIHVFAISGLHVMVLARIVIYLLLFLALPVRFAGLVLIPVLWFYVAMIGFPPSAVRATLMVSFHALAPVFWRRPNGMVAWAQAFLLVHVLAPERLTDVGSQMSFAVMFALILGARCLKGRGHVASVLLFSLIAWGAGVPIAARVFGRLTPGGLFSNLVVLPLATVGVVAGALGMLTSYVSADCAVHLNNLAGLMSRTMALISDAVADVPGASLTVPSWPLWECALWYVACALFLWLLARLQRAKDDII